MYYSTPRAKSNLPRGLEMVTSTAGHQFFFDPQQRPFLTAVGYVNPVEATAKPSVLETVTAPIKQVASTVTDALASAGSALRTAAFDPVSRPKVDVGPRGLEALAPNGLRTTPAATDYPLNHDLAPRPMAQVSYALGNKRPGKPDAGLVGLIQDTVTDVLGPEYGVEVYSGRQSAKKQYGSNRHNTGFAADVYITDPNGKRLNPIDNQQQMLDVAQAFAAKGGLGVGLGTQLKSGAPYMSEGIHLDMVEPGPGQDYEWGDVGDANADLLATARNNSLMPSSFYEKALPQTIDAPQPLDPDPLIAAPLGQVERAPLAAATPRSATPIAAAPSGTVERAALAAAQPREPDVERFGPRTTTMTARTERLSQLSDPLASLISSASAAPMPNRPSPSMDTMLGKGTVTAPSFTSARMTAPATSLPAQKMTTPAKPVQQPSPAKQAAVYQQAAASRAVPAPVNSMNSIPRGSMLQPPAPTAPAKAALMSPSLMGPAQSLVPQGPQPLFTPAPAMPAVKPQVVAQPKIAQPVTTPTTARVKTPQQRINDAFALAAPPAPKFTAADIYGGQVGTGTATGGNSVSRFENNPNTYVTNAFGVTTATGPNGNQMAVKGTPGPLSKASLSDPLAGMLGKMPSGKVVAGTLLGAALGNAIAGPLAGAVGAKLGGKLASGNIAQNSLLSKLMGGYSTNILGQRMTFANPTSGGPFPNAPDRPSGSDRSYDVSRGRDISPGASREIESGGGGLY